MIINMSKKNPLIKAVRYVYGTPTRLCDFIKPLIHLILITIGIIPMVITLWTWISGGYSELDTHSKSSVFMVFVYAIGLIELAIVSMVLIIVACMILPEHIENFKAKYSKYFCIPIKYIEDENDDR